MGVVLDVRCPFGISLLRMSSEEYLFGRSYVWLLIVENLEEINSIIGSINLSLDSDMTVLAGSYQLFDIYKTHYQRSLIVTHIQNWSLVNGFMDVSRKPNRMDLQGLVFNTKLVINSPNYEDVKSYEDWMETSFRSDVSRITRENIRIFSHLKEALNVTFNASYSLDYGYITKYGNFTGLLGDITRGHVDFSLTFFIIRTERMYLVDYIYHYSSKGIGFSFLQQKTFGTCTALLTPLNADVWMYFGLLCLMFLLIFRAISRYDKSKDIASWGAAFVYVVGAVAHQGFEDTVKFSSSRLLNITLLLFTYLVSVYYNAAVLNGLLSPSPDSILTLDQLLNSGFRLGVEDASYSRDRSSEVSVFGTNGSQRTHLYKLFDATSNLYHSIPQGVNRIRKGKFAFYTPYLQIYPLAESTFTEAQLCSLYHIPVVPPVPAGIIARNNSPYSETFRLMFTVMTQTGLFDRANSEWYVEKPLCQWRQDATHIGTESLTAAYVILLFGIVYSLLYLFGEIIWHRKMKDVKIHPLRNVSLRH